MSSRTIKQQDLSTPAYASAIALNAINADNTDSEVEEYNAIICRVFTAFMIEGVIHHIGYSIVPKWDEPKDKHGKPTNKAHSRQKYCDRHKHIRRELGLCNDTKRFRCIAKFMEELFEFRDSFAHPKLLTRAEPIVVPDDTFFPLLEWQEHHDIKKAKKDYKFAKTYCQKLLDTAARFIEEKTKISYPEDNSIMLPEHVRDNPSKEASSLTGLLSIKGLVQF